MIDDINIMEPQNGDDDDKDKDKEGEEKKEGDSTE